MQRRVSVIFLTFFVALAFASWMTDFVTLEGEWTIYTAVCDGGDWVGSSCTGHLVPGARYRFRTLRAHREVLFWTAGDRGESGRFINCQIRDQRNWSCPATASTVRTITRQMVHGRPVAEPEAAQVHCVPKWEWEALSLFRRAAA